MTAMSLIVQRKRRTAYLISDCAWTDTAGRVTHVAGKIISFDRFPAAIGVQGNVSMPALGAELQREDPHNVARLVQILPACLRRAIEATYAIHPETKAGTVIGILRLAAWSSRQARAIGYVITSDAAMAAAMGGAEWFMHEATSVLSVAECPTPLFANLRDCEDPVLFDPAEQAFDLIAHERRTPQTIMNPGADHAARFRVGCKAQLTEVTRRGVKVWDCGDFPDRVGELIDPALQ